MRVCLRLAKCSRNCSMLNELHDVEGRSSSGASARIKSPPHNLYSVACGTMFSVAKDAAWWPTGHQHLATDRNKGGWGGGAHAAFTSKGWSEGRTAASKRGAQPASCRRQRARSAGGRAIGGGAARSATQAFIAPRVASGKAACPRGEITRLPADSASHCIADTVIEPRPYRGLGLADSRQVVVTEARSQRQHLRRGQRLPRA
jgi:hypothetical protein